MLKHNFLIAMINDMDHIKDPYILSTCQNMLYYNVKEFGWESNTEIFRSAMDAIVYAVDNNYEHLIISYPGNDLEKNGRLNHALDEFITEDDFIVGHLLDRDDSYYELHEQLIYINTVKWTQLGKPNFGEWGETCEYTIPERSAQNHHDDYTPYWIKPGTEKKTYTKCRSFHNLISAGLEAGYTIRSFNREVRDSKTYIYPEDENCKDNIQAILDKGFEPRFYAKNTERLPLNKIKSQISKVNKLVTVAAGLNHLKLLYSIGYDKDTVLHFVDFDEFAINSMKFLYKRWNGYNYTKFLQHLPKEEGKEFITGNPGSKWWFDFTDFFGGDAEFADFFQDLKDTITVKFDKVDLLNPDDHCKSVLSTDDPQNTLYWFSNIFHYKPTSYIQSKSSIAQKQDNLMAILNQESMVYMDNVVLDKDKLFTVSDYVDTYERTVEFEKYCLGK